MEILKDRSINYILSLIVQLKKDYGIEFTYKDIKELVEANHNLGRPDLARLCVKYGHAKTIQEAFDKYLIQMYERLRKYNIKPSAEECIKLIHNAGGDAILAHPYQLKLFPHQLEYKLTELITYGLDGIELYHSNHTPEQIELYKFIPYT